MKNSFYIMSFLFINVICFAQTKDSQPNEKTKKEKEVDWNKVNELEERMLQESIRNSGCRFDVKPNFEDYKKYSVQPNPYGDNSKIKREY